MNLAPNDVNLVFHEHQRLGTQCRRLHLKSKIDSINTLRDNFFSHTAPKLYNIIPKIVKCAENIDSFKRKLDTFLKKIPDYPPIPGYARANSNSLTEWVGNMQQEKNQMIQEETGRLLYKNVEAQQEVLDGC